MTDNRHIWPDWARKIYRRIFPEWTKYLKAELSDCESVLDLGCGNNSPIQYCRVPFSVGVDLFEAYLEESKARGIHHEYVQGDIKKVDFEPKSFDAVILIEVIEHLTKAEGYSLIEKVETWATDKIIITTPNGFLRQEQYDGNPLQEHVSAWCVSDLRKLGFKVYGVCGWKRLRGERGAVKRFKCPYIWVKISNLSQKITYYYPKLAFQLFAVKQIRPA